MDEEQSDSAGSVVSWTTYGKMQDDNRALLRVLLETMAAGGGTRTPNQQKIGDYYQACMAESKLESLGASPLDPAVDGDRQDSIDC